MKFEDLKWEPHPFIPQFARAVHNWMSILKTGEFFGVVINKGGYEVMDWTGEVHRNLTHEDVERIINS